MSSRTDRFAGNGTGHVKNLKRRLKSDFERLMKLPFWIGVLLSIFLMGLPLHSGYAKSLIDDPDFDRFDGTGKSGKRVNVIEWEGNLEIHVYPGGSLKGLGLKLDERDGKKVMVISYRFDTMPRPEIRRALVSIPFREGFQAYREKTKNNEYDKVVISNNVLSSLTKFELDAEPKQLFPDGHPMLADQEEKSGDKKDGKTAGASGSRPVSPLGERPVEASSVPSGVGVSRSISGFNTGDTGAEAVDPLGYKTPSRVIEPQGGNKASVQNPVRPSAAQVKQQEILEDTGSLKSFNF